MGILKLKVKIWRTKMATRDLGWCFARCNLEDERLDITSPESDDEPAVTFTLSGRAAILALQDLITTALEDEEAGAAMAKDLPMGG